MMRTGARRVVHLIIALSAVGLLFAAESGKKGAAKASDSAAFDQSVLPILQKTCAGCHNAQLSSGGINLAPYSDFSSIAEHRSDWEKILQKIRTGEMPPRGVARLGQSQIDSLVKAVNDEFDKAYRAVKPDP